MLAPEHSRAGIMEALQASATDYGTTGCRMVLDARVHFDNPAELFAEDPTWAIRRRIVVSPEAMMGDILGSDDGEVAFASMSTLRALLNVSMCATGWRRSRSSVLTPGST